MLKKKHPLFFFFLMCGDEPELRSCTQTGGFFYLDSNNCVHPLYLATTKNIKNYVRCHLKQAGSVRT